MTMGGRAPYANPTGQAVNPISAKLAGNFVGMLLSRSSNVKPEKLKALEKVEIMDRLQRVTDKQLRDLKARNAQLEVRNPKGNPYGRA